MQTKPSNGREELEAYRRLSRLLAYLAGIITLTFILGMFTYNGSFSLMDDPYSDLGRFWGSEGNLNIIAGIIFAGGLMLCALICFHIEKIVRKRYNKGLFTVCGIGFLMMIAPADVLNVIHVLGVILVLGSLWFFTVKRLRELRAFIGIPRFLSYQLLLNGTILPYAYLYFTGNSARDFMQKLALMGLIATVIFVGIELRRLKEKATD